MIKTYVIDTNVLLHSPQSIRSFEDNHVILPMAVIEELDKFKSHNDELGRNAREVIRTLDFLREKGSLKDGVKLDNEKNGKISGTLRIVTGKGIIPDTELDMEIPDNRILRVAYALHKKGENVRFVSKDINVRIKADALGMEVMDFENEKVNVDNLFFGCREIELPGKDINEFYKTGTMPIPGNIKLLPNEFILIKDDLNPKHSALCRADGENSVKQLASASEKAWNITPRSKEQRMAMEVLMDPEIELVTLVGQAGTGKTLLALAAALESVLHGKKYQKILVSRPIIPMGKDIGYLPGDKDEKLFNWMQPIFDNLDYLMHSEKKDQSGRKIVDDLVKNDVLELEALTYIRGRSIPRQYLIVDEAQNLTPHEIKTIISRAGDETKIVLTGDPFQIDNPYLDSESNGLIYAAERFKSHPIHGHVTLLKSERSALAAAAAEYL